MPSTPEPGCRLEAKVTPRSSRNRIELTGQGTLQIWTTAPPTDGQANAAICEMVAKRLGIAKWRVAVVRGDASRHKTLSIEGLGLEDVRSRLLG